MTCKRPLLHVVHSDLESPFLISLPCLGKRWDVTPNELLARFLGFRPSFPQSCGNTCVCSTFLLLTQHSSP